MSQWPLPAHVADRPRKFQDQINPNVCICFPPDVFQELQAISERDKTSISSIVGGMVALWLRE